MNDGYISVFNLFLYLPVM